MSDMQMHPDIQYVMVSVVELRITEGYCLLSHPSISADVAGASVLELMAHAKDVYITQFLMIAVDTHSGNMLPPIGWE